MNRQIINQIKALIALSFWVVCIANSAYSQTYARNGMVVSSSTIASEVGVEILKQGGNAIDASVATAFALAVTHPAAGNIGGGGFLVFLDSAGSATTIDFREKAPLAATPEMYLDDNGNLPKGTNLNGRESTVNHVGLKSVGVPGTVAGLFLAHQQYGSMPWAKLVQPAIDLALHGFELTYRLYSDAQFFRAESNIPFLQQYFDNADGEITAFGEMWKQGALANTLEAIRDEGHDGFYRGAIAEKIAAFMKANGGLITTEDLAKYKAIERPPVTGTYGDYTIHSMSPPSSGGVALVEMLNQMEWANLDSVELNSAEYVHLLVEVMRRAFADRANYLGDPDFNPDMPVEALTGKSFAKKRFESIDMTRASISDSSRFGQLYEGSNTTHLSVADQFGNAVSLTYTLEHSYGSGMGSPELGFIFNNEMGDFNPIPGHTSRTGIIGTAPNLIAPEKRMLSSMTPTIVSMDGKPFLVIGSPGGRTIINTVFQTILGVLEYELRVDQAIESLKVHHQWLPDVIYYERLNLSPDTRSALEQMGHKLKPVNALGELMGIQIDAEKGIIIGAADSRSSDGAAVGY